MGIKADKTFEEIVERLVALFKPQSEHTDIDSRSRPSSPDTTENNPSAAVPPSPPDDKTS